jgi:acetylornithine/succinyldiaminopimelate/putrescine aminotransferase
MARAVETGTVPEALAAAESPHLFPVYPQLGIEPVAGEGMRLTTRDGRELLDFYGGHAVALLGYGHPRLLSALAAQAESLFFQTTAVPQAARVRAAERLAAFVGLPRVFFVNSGAEANENALRLAFRATGRPRAVALAGAFHGRTAAAAAVTHGAARWYGFPRPPFEVTFVPPGDLAALSAALRPDAAALILEPVQGLAGAVDLGGEYLEAARAFTRRAGALLIFDEVQCGMGRTGWPSSLQRWGVAPDLLTLAKGLAGGFPAAALLATEEVAATVSFGDLGTTFGGGPLACRLLTAVLDVLEEPGFLPRVRERSEELRQRCLARGPVVAVQGAGLLLGLRLSRPAKEVQGELLARGILAGTSADPEVLRLLPPLTIGREEIDRLAAALAELRP